MFPTLEVRGPSHDPYHIITNCVISIVNIHQISIITLSTLSEYHHSNNIMRPTITPRPTPTPTMPPTTPPTTMTPPPPPNIRRRNRPLPRFPYMQKNGQNRRPDKKNRLHNPKRKTRLQHLTALIQIRGKRVPRLRAG